MAIEGVVEAAWKDYARRTFHGVPASEIQRRETKKAFYAGAGMLLESLSRILGPGQEATDADVAMLEGIHQEIRAYVERVVQGRE